MRNRSGFTLMEMLISLMIFSVISLGMVGILIAATRVYRAGEAGKAAMDDSLAVLAQLDDDLKRMVAGADGGFLYTRVKWGGSGDAGGDMALAIKIRNPDPTAIGVDGKKARLIVVYWVDANGDLNRGVDTAADSDANTATTSEFDVAKAIFGAARPDDVISKDCLYFGVDLSQVSGSRSTLDWTGSTLPTGTTPFSTEAITSGASAVTASAFPEALRVTLTLTGGSRNKFEGTYIGDLSPGIRVSGFAQVPLREGYARIGKLGSGAEWIRFDSLQSGVLAWSDPLGTGSDGRAQRRTDRVAHTRGDAVVIGNSYSIVRTLPR